MRKAKIAKGKILSGSEIAGYVKERQAAEVGTFMAENNGRAPKLVIIRDNADPVIAKYVGLKKRYGEDIGVEVVDEFVETGKIGGAVAAANSDTGSSGIIIQLPLIDGVKTEDYTAAIKAEKDVDGLSGGKVFDSATATAILWLLAGNGIELVGKKVALVGRGKLVGRPLAEMLGRSGVDFEVFGRGADLAAELPRFDVVVTATGQPGLIKPEMLSPGTTVVDAGTASEKGVIAGDVADETREREDISITPKIGGVGPLTVAVLFENVIRAAILAAKNKS